MKWLARLRRTRWNPSFIYMMVAWVMAGVMWLTLRNYSVYDNGISWRAFENPVLDGWSRWDGMWYRAISESGYWMLPGKQSSVAFFPVYPLLLAVGSELTSLRALRVGVFVTMAAGMVAAVVFDRWCQLRIRPEARVPALATLLLYPFAFYLYGAVYADALYLSLALGAFLLVERDKPVLAGVVAAIATGTRPVGIALVLGLVLRVLERREVFSTRSLRQLRRGDLGVLLAPAGLIAYAAYLLVQFGDPMAFVTTQAAWGHVPGPATWFKAEWFKYFVDSAWGRGHAILGAHAFLTLGALALVPSVWRRFGPPYAVYVAVTVLLPAISSKDFMGMGRYILAAFPLFALAGEALSSRTWLRRVVHALSFAGMASLAALFARWDYVS